MTKLKVGVIGLGVGEQHLDAFDRHPSCEVVAVCDYSDERLASIRERLPEISVSRSADDLLSDSAIDLVSIASYDDHHFAQVIKALESKKHVFVEKPLCRTTAELEAIKNLWESHNGLVKLGSNLILRAAPLYMWLKQQIAEGRFGEIYAFDGDYLYGRLHKITEGWRRNVNNYSVIEGGGIHLLDMLVWLTGERPSSVMAIGNNISTRETGFRYNDYVSATLQCPSGLVARITANFGCVHRHQHVLKVYGTSATFIYDDAGARVHDSRDPKAASSEIKMDSLPATKGDLIASFVDSIERNVDMSKESQSHFDVISISAACDQALASRMLTEVRYV